MSDAGQLWQGGMGRRWKIGSESPVHADTRQYWSTPQVRLVACTCTISVCFAIWKNMLVLTLNRQEDIFGRISYTAKTCFQPAQWLHKPRAKSTQSVLLILTFPEAAFEQTSQCERLAWEIIFRVHYCLCFAFVNDAVISTFRSAEPAPHGMQRGPSSMHRMAPRCPSLPTTISSLQHHVSSSSAAHDVAETINESACISSATLADNCGQTAAPDAALSHLCVAGADAASNAETSHASSRAQSGMLLSAVLYGATSSGLGHDDLQVASVPDASSKSFEPRSLHSPVQHAAQHDAVADGATKASSCAALQFSSADSQFV